MSNKVFLGGTCNNSTWRETLIRALHPKVTFFNPVVDDWNEEAQMEEMRQRVSCQYALYVITSEMTGVYSIAEVIDDSNKRPKKTLFCYIPDGFEPSQVKSLESVSKMVERNGGITFVSLNDIAAFLNSDQILSEAIGLI